MDTNLFGTLSEFLPTVGCFYVGYFLQDILEIIMFRRSILHGFVTVFRTEFCLIVPWTCSIYLFVCLPTSFVRMFLRVSACICLFLGLLIWLMLFYVDWSMLILCWFMLTRIDFLRTQKHSGKRITAYVFV